MQARLIDEATGKHRMVRLQVDGDMLIYSELNAEDEITAFPITLISEHDGSLRIISGHRRIAAFLEIALRSRIGS